MLRYLYKTWKKTRAVYPEYYRVFGYALMIASAAVLPVWILGCGHFSYYGDFNAQQIPFYTECIRSVQNGNFGWNWNTDLGSNFIGSYGYYTLGSPFFWLACLFPAESVQFLMAPLLILKLSLTAVFAYAYLRRFVNNNNYAIVGALLYAFSGFSLQNIFYFQFHESLCFFPLLLFTLEANLVDKRRGAFALAVALNTFSNYIMFASECVFLVIYFMCRLLSREFKFTWKDFVCLAIESIVGVGLAGVLLVPSLVLLFDNPRLSEHLNGLELLYYQPLSRYGQIVASMFISPDFQGITTLFPGSETLWSSCSLYVPLFGMTGVIAILKKKSWLGTLIVIGMVFLFVPGLNALFTVGLKTYYMRWSFMLTLMFCLATARVLDAGVSLKLSARWNVLLTAAISLIAIILRAVDSDSANLAGSVYFNIAISLCSALLLIFCIADRPRTYIHIDRLVLKSTVLVCVTLGVYYVFVGRLYGYNTEAKGYLMPPQIGDASDYRVEASPFMYNVNMLWDVRGTASFSSTVSGAIYDLQDALGYPRTVRSEIPGSDYAYRTLIGAKYFVDYKSDSAENVPCTFELVKSDAQHNIYENQYVLSIGYAYDRCILLDDLKTFDSRSNLMLRAVALTEEQIERYSTLVTRIELSDCEDLSIAAFKQDYAERLSEGVQNFLFTNDGFSAETNYEIERFVVFSVPFDTGWIAEVNGTVIPAEQVNGGFIGIEVPAGEVSIEFTYKTPGLKQGVLITLVSAAALVGYNSICGCLRKGSKTARSKFNRR